MGGLFIRLLKNKKGEGTVFILIMVFVILTLVGIISEIYRMNILQQHCEYELQRAVNCAVEFAMGDSYRQDKMGNLNISLAKNEFYKYLSTDLGLDGYNRKYNDGSLIYTLYFDNINGIVTPPKLTVQGTLKAKSIFSFLVGEIQIPFNISSRNSRTD